VRDNLWDPHDQIKIGLSNYLSGQVNFISGLLQSTHSMLEFSPQIRADNLRGS
jgi:hypothetical protein